MLTQPSLFHYISVSAERRRISPSSTLHSIGSLAVPWGWVPSNLVPHLEWSGPVPHPLPPGGLVLMQIVEGIEWFRYVYCSCLSPAITYSWHRQLTQSFLSRARWKRPILSTFFLDPLSGSSVSIVRVHKTHYFIPILVS